MRRKDREITERERLEMILHESQVGRLGTVSRDGTAMIKPVNFLYRNGRIYFHSAMEGEKMDHLALRSRVCFEVDEVLGYQSAFDSPCEASFAFRSVILQGQARLVEDPEEKIKILHDLVEKYQPGARLRPLSKRKVQEVSIVEIIADRITGKEKRPSQIKPQPPNP